MTEPKPITLSPTFTLEEFAMLARIVDAGMWELASKPRSDAESMLCDRVCAKLAMPGYEETR